MSIHQPLNSQVISYGKILVDTNSCRVTYDGQIITLLPKEYKLLLLFLSYPNHVLSYEIIVDKLWEVEKFPTPSSIRSHIKGLRKAFQKINGDVIETVHGLGYRLKPLNQSQSANSILAPSISVMQNFLKAKAVEYIAITKEFIIQYISPGLVNYCDYPEALQIGVKAVNAFPEFVGYEETFQEIMDKKQNTFEVKGIARAANPNRPDYINFYLFPDDSKNLQQKGDNFLFIFFEDASEQMSFKQRVVQLENEFYLQLHKS